MKETPDKDERDSGEDLSHGKDEKGRNASVYGKDPVGKNTNDEIISEMKKKVEGSQDGVAEGEETGAKTSIFTRDRMMLAPEFSISNLDAYIHNKYRNVDPNIRYLVEIVVVFFLVFFFPIAVLLFKKGIRGMLDFYDDRAVDKRTLFYLRNSKFISFGYAIFILSKLFVDNMLYLSLFLLRLFDISIDGIIGVVLQVVIKSSSSLRNAIASFMTFFLAERMYGKYQFFSNDLRLSHFMMTLLFWFGCLSLMLFAEKISINIILGQPERSNLRNRIASVNSKLFVFRKLVAVAEANQYNSGEVEYIIRTMKPEFDSGLFLRYNDLKISDDTETKMLAKSIFTYLGISELSYRLVSDIFLKDGQDVYNYLSNNRCSESKDPISYELFESDLLSIANERRNIQRSMFDKSGVVKSLNVVFMIAVGFLGMILLLFLLNVNYRVYIASIGPFLFATGWIFHDSVKELYKCFVFLLISHLFDVGDRVVINSEELIVVGIDLLYSTFETLSGRTVYIPNMMLTSLVIRNVRRSKLECDDLRVFVDGEVSIDRIARFRNDLSSALKESGQGFTGNVFVQCCDRVDDKTRVNIIVQHASNFQDIERVYERRIWLFNAVSDVMSKSGMKCRDFAIS